jgi:hypothetical protein
MSKKKSEKRIQTEIMDFCLERMYNKNDLFIMRCHTGYAFKNQMNLIRLAEIGTPDIIIGFKGKMYGFELKREAGGKQSTEQKQMQKRFKKAKLEYHVVRSLAEVVEILGI